MYKVMKAIYDSGIPVSFKGSMVLRACLLELGYKEETRHTVDIDASWNSDFWPTADQMVVSFQNALTDNCLDLKVRLCRMYAEGRSAGFEMADEKTGEILFTMDVDVNRPLPSTKIYEIEEVRFCGASPLQMIADKLLVVSSDRILRRIKDVVDLYYFSNVFVFDCGAVQDTLKKSGKSLADFNVFLYRPEELEHAYSKFRFSPDVSKPTFSEMYRTVKNYIHTVLPV